MPKGTSNATGPNCSNARSYIIAYSLEEAGEIYAGTRKHNDTQPKWKVPMPFGVGSQLAGLAYHRPSATLIVSSTWGSAPSMHYVKIGGSVTPPLPPPPPPPPSPPMELMPTQGFIVDGAVPGSDIHVIAGFSSQDATYHGCPVGVYRNAKHDPFLIKAVTTDSTGRGEVVMHHYPNRTIYVQSVDLETCGVSEVVEVEP